MVLRDRRPWLAVEAKLSEEAPSPHWGKFLKQLGVPWGLQLVARSGVWREQRLAFGRVLIASADEALAYFA